MSVYSSASSGTKLFRSRQNKGYRHLLDCEFGRLYPVFSRFVLPGDVWKCGANMLIRYQPTMSPPLTRAWARMRYFYVPLRQVESNCEQIITGSENGKLIETTLPEFESVFATAGDDYLNPAKWSLIDYFGWPTIDYSSIKDNKSIPRAYWIKAYYKIWFDYYRDENLDTVNSDFDTFVSSRLAKIGTQVPIGIRLHKDYFMSALPWQLKGVAPTFDITVTNPFIAGQNVPINLGDVYNSGDTIPAKEMYAKLDSDIYYARFSADDVEIPGGSTTLYETHVSTDDLNSQFSSLAGSFNVADLRDMFAQTRIFERLARTGSRYTEYLRANFGVAPADDTLQRPMYLGGFRQPIVTTEVVSTADSTNSDGTVRYPVGTLRGHGISNGGNTIKPFVAKEFGMVFGLLDITPEIQYTQGVEREYTYGSRFDFFNPSFQNLSEQEVRNGEIFLSPDDGLNDDTFGFQPIYNELRSSRDIVSGDLKDNLSYWTQSIEFSSRPNLNGNFVAANTYTTSFMKPFVVTDTSTAKPIICDVYNIADVYRPMVRESVPGLIDHN